MRYLLIFLLVTSSYVLKAQEEYYDYDAALREMEDKPRYGLFGNYNLNFHNTDFRTLPNVPSCCPLYTNGEGQGFSFGALYDHPLYEDLFVSNRLSFQSFSADFSRIEEVWVILDGQSYLGKFEHAVQADFSRIQFFPYLTYRIAGSLFAHGGADFSIITSAEYQQIEVIKDPVDRGTFEDGRRYRNDNSGDIDNVNRINLGLRLGLSYELPMSVTRSLKLVPELFYSYWLIPAVSERKWNIHHIDFGVSVKYTEPPPPPPPPVPPLPPPMPKPILPGDPPELLATIKAVEVDSTQKESPNFSVRLEDFTSLSLRPLLNFIFFDNNSSEIPQRYSKLSPDKAESFTLKSIGTSDALETYYHVLNIIGRRLVDNPQVEIDLVGNNANIDEEKNNRELSMARANAVKQYFTDVWKIDEKRITVTARNLPKEATDSDEEGADDENRRVEIHSNSPVLSEPVITGDTIRVLSNTIIRFYPQSNAEAGIKNWKLIIRQNNRDIKEFNGTGELPPSIDWVLQNEDPNAPHKAGNLSYSFFVYDNINQSYETKVQRIPMEQLTVDRKRLERREDKEFEYYRLILFDYASSNLKLEHRNVVDYIKDRITPFSTVVVTGYTDRIGKDEVNKRISTQRANAVAKRLSVPLASVKGVGESALLYGNELPEARFYCRTVTITIETPVIE